MLKFCEARVIMLNLPTSARNHDTAQGSSIDGWSKCVGRPADQQMSTKR